MKQVLFIQGGGNGGYKTDVPMVDSLKRSLGNNYNVHYPQMHPDETMPDFASQWLTRIGKEITEADNGLILTGHSLGASMLLKYLSENKVNKIIAGIFLIAPPFWSGDQDWIQPLKLKEDFDAYLPTDLPVFFYHCKDDEIVPFDHFVTYMKHLPRAVFRELPNGGHQLNNDLSLVAADIKML